MSDILKINYDDFYKFLVSAGIIAIIVGSTVSAYFFQANNNENWRLAISAIYFIFAVIGVGGVVCGLKKWYKNQKLLDEKLGLEVDIMRIRSAALREKFQREKREQEASGIATAIPERNVE